MKLISLGNVFTFYHLRSKIITQWSELKQGQFSLSCSFGNLNNCVLESDDDIINTQYICKDSTFNVVDVDLFEQSEKLDDASIIENVDDVGFSDKVHDVFDLFGIDNVVIVAFTEPIEQNSNLPGRSVAVPDDGFSVQYT